MRATVKWVSRADLEQIALHMIRTQPDCVGVARVVIEPGNRSNGDWSFGLPELGTAPFGMVEVAMRSIGPILMARYLLKN
jgi:hypothetical protein